MNGISRHDLAVVPASLANIRSFIEKHHYSHSCNGVKVEHCFAVGLEGELVGAVLYGSLSTTAWQRFSCNETAVVELRRLCLLDEIGKNAESFVVGWTLRWLRRERPDLEVVVSYADPYHGHEGTIYKAANFEYWGLTQTDVAYRDQDSGRVYHSRALRTKANGDYKPFVKVLRAKHDEGRLEEVSLPGKHCYVYKLRQPRRPAAGAGVQRSAGCPGVRGR